MKILKSRKAKKASLIASLVLSCTLLSGCNPVREVGGILYYEFTGSRKYLDKKEEQLDLSNANVRDLITEPAILKAIEKIELSDINSLNRVYDLVLNEPYTIDELANFKNLKTLVINDGYQNYTDTFELMPNLTNLILRRCNNLLKLDDLKNTNISFLILDGLANVENYSFINEMPNLESLDVHSCPNFNINEITNKNIKSITISNINEDDLEFLSKLENLESIIITNSTISSLKGINHFPKLRSIILNDCFITDINELYSLPNLEDISITNNSIDEIDLTRFPNLKSFYYKMNYKLYTDEIFTYCHENHIRSDVTADELKNMKIIRKYVEDLELDGLSNEEKAYKIYEFVMDHMEYDTEGAKDLCTSLKYNEDGLKYAVAGFGVCINYAYLYDAMCDEVGINAYYVTGLGIGKKESAPHGWNIIEYDGKYRLCDSTWSDGLTSEEDKFYNCTGNAAKEFNETHLEGEYNKNKTPIRIRTNKPCQN